MNDGDKTKEQLIHEVLELSQRIADMESSEIKRKRVQEALKESEKKYATIIEKSNDGIVILQDGAFKYINPKMVEIAHFDVKDLLGKSFIDFVAPNFKDLVLRRYQKRISGESVPEKYEIEIITREGRTIPVEISPSLIEYDGKPADMAIIRDITERKKVEHEMIIAQKLESVGTLAGGIAHDFNNLLQAILGNVSLARMYLASHSSESVSSLLEQAEETLETAKQLSFRLLTFSKGGEPLRRVSSAEDILRKSIDLSLSGSNVTCDLTLPHDLWPIEIDEGQMTQVFNNILMNAKEAMPDGGTVSISARNTIIQQSDPLPLKEGAYVQVSIKDHGLGMTEDIMSKIFDPYFSTRGLGSRKGSGLGLSICLSIVAKHEGHISVESEKGTGTNFHVYLPALKETSCGQESAKAQPQDISRRRLLFMDDDENIRHLVGEMVEFLGYEAEFAEDGEEAVEKYRRSKESGEPFDVVILDLTVQGGMGGDKAIKKLIEIDPDVKAIISSGYVDAPVMRDYEQYGFVDAMVKPYRMEQLKETLDKLCSAG